MATTYVSPRPGSPESATLVVLQAYDDPTTSHHSSSQAAGSTQPDIPEDAGTVESPSRSDFRLSTTSYCSTVSLVPPHPGSDNCSRPRAEFKESPFRWNYPSLPDLSVVQQESNSNDVTNNGEKPTMRIWEGWKVILCCSWFNLLLLLMPVTWVLSSVSEKHHKVVFTFCILSMIPLVKLHDLSIKELAIRFGGSKTGLLNASMGNTVELVIAVSIFVVSVVDEVIVQSSLIGSMLSKLLLVLGMCFFAGGLRFSEQGFDQTATQIHSSLLSISVSALLLPAVYHFALSGVRDSIGIEQREDILEMSYGVSIVLLFIYMLYLLFQFWSHRHLYKDTKQRSNRLSVKIPINPRFISERRIFSKETIRTSHSDSESLRWRPSVATESRIAPFLRAPSRQFGLRSPSETTLVTPSYSASVNAEKPIDSNPTVRLVTQALKDYNGQGPSGVSGSSLPTSLGGSEDEMPNQIEGNHHRLPEPVLDAATIPPPGRESTLSTKSESLIEPRLSLTMTLFLLTAVTILASFNAEELVESMDGISTTISKQWVGLILLPVVSSVAECVTAMNVSVKDQLGLSVSVAVGSAIQITLFIIPFMVTLGWGLNKPLALLFDPFESVVLYISVQTMSHVVADGKSNWLDGAILISLYVIIAVSFWYYPGQPSEIAVCAVSI